MSASRRKKRGSSSKEALGSKTERAGSDEPASSPPKQESLPPARPPRKNLPLLILCTALFAVWLAILGSVALFFS